MGKFTFTTFWVNRKNAIDYSGNTIENGDDDIMELYKNVNKPFTKMYTTKDNTKDNRKGIFNQKNSKTTYPKCNNCKMTASNIKKGQDCPYCGNAN